MSLATLELPPVLTPRMIASLNGRVSEPAKEELLKVLRASIAQCFAPFVARKSAKLDLAFAEASGTYLRYRIWIVYRLGELVGKQGLVDLTGSLPELLGKFRPEKLTELGLAADRLRGILQKYVGIAQNLIRHSGGVSIDVNHGSVRNALQHSLVSATDLDFAITLIFLGLEDEVQLDRTHARFALQRAGKALREWEHHLARVVTPATAIVEVSLVDLAARASAEVPLEEWNKVPTDLASRLDDHLYGQSKVE